jgi:Flp pilus assembly pilin Flp
MTYLLMSPFVALQVAVHALAEREDGQTKTEYAILFAFVGIPIIVALYFLSNTLSSDCGLCDDAASSVSAPGP